MPSTHLVDPELLPALEAFTPITLATENLPALRAASAQAFAAIQAPDLPVTVETLTIPGPLRILAYRPATAAGPLPAILHFHGGGYVLGAPEMMDSANRTLAAELGCAVFALAYRLAPETPAPGAVEDAYAALTYLAAHAGELQIDPARIGIKGESAGGGLAAALALLARDRGGVQPAFQHLIYPMIDDRTTTHPFAGEFIWTPELNQFGWAALLGHAPGAPHISPYAAAARAENLAGLPPAYIATGALDLFVEENLEYARRLLRAGVPVELHVYPGAYHGFDVFPGARVVTAAIRDSTEALRKAMFG
jgi:triacylglycerol lipase